MNKALYKANLNDYRHLFSHTKQETSFTATEKQRHPFVFINNEADTQVITHWSELLKEYIEDENIAPLWEGHYYQLGLLIATGIKKHPTLNPIQFISKTSPSINETRNLICCFWLGVLGHPNGSKLIHLAKNNQDFPVIYNFWKLADALEAKLASSVPNKTIVLNNVIAGALTMANDTYYGIYMNHSDINEILKRPVILLNERASVRLRAAAATMEIPKTKLNQKLRFYILEEPEVAKLASDINATFYVIKYNSFSQPIISIKVSDVDSTFNRFIPFYPTESMYGPITYTQLKDELEAIFSLI
ncbi:MAG: hypothetical protein NTV66_05600 [Methylococcales bacterium]|nr:hypothetical protein [Methylococcales bacterium]